MNKLARYGVRGLVFSGLAMVAGFLGCAATIGSALGGAGASDVEELVLNLSIVTLLAGALGVLVSLGLLIASAFVK